MKQGLTLSDIIENMLIDMAWEVITEMGVISRLMQDDDRDDLNDYLEQIAKGIKDGYVK